MSFEPTSGYSTTRTSTVFSDGENQQRAEVVASLNGDWVLESYSTDKSSAVVTDGVNKQRAVVTYNLNGGSGGGSVSGNYLPLTGGTLTGDLTIKKDSGNTVEKVLTLSHGSEDIVINKIRYGKTLDFNNTTLTGLANVSPTQSKGELGTAGAYWVKAYIRSLNAGGGGAAGDITIPTEGGTLARIEDIDEVVGNISTLLDAINGESI